MEIGELLRFVSALVFVIGLIVACAWAARRFGLVQTGEKTSPQGRLTVVETLSIDPKRKLLLIRHDDREHLIMVGDQDLILDTGLPARTDLDHTDLNVDLPATSTKKPQPNILADSVAGQMQKVVSLLKERRA